MANATPGLFVWYEHLTRNVDAAKAFYGEVMGWSTRPFGDGYELWVGSQGPLGGVMKLPPEVERSGVPPHWMAHVVVDDVDATVAAARRLGGKILHDPTPIPTVGRFAIVGDPQGAALSVFRPESPMALHDPAKDGEFCWNELVTGDPAAALKFYSELFGWRPMEAIDLGPMGTYRTFGAGERGLGGMMAIPEGNPMPPVWIFYASTSDLGAAVARATAKGGQVVSGPMDVPGGGRIAQLTDPQGALFALHQAPR